MSASPFGLRQDAPGVRRMLQRLETLGPATRYRLALECHLDQNHAANLVRRLRALPGLIHIAAWALPENGRGPWTPVYALGAGRDARKPIPSTPAQKSRLRRARLIEKIGVHHADRILRSRQAGGIDTLVIDGRTVYRRGEGLLI